MDMAAALAERLQKEAPSLEQQINRGYRLCYGRPATPAETTSCVSFVRQQNLTALCRVLLNTTELISVR